MNEQMIGQWIILGIIVTMIAFDKVKAWQIKNGRKNNSDNPGNFGERIAKLEEKAENIEGDIDEIKQKLNKMNSYRK